MRAVRVEAEGLTTSFRYPHFLVGRQPTFRMPPPATIYGHICSAVGDFVEPSALRFAYAFHSAGAGDDMELLHIAAIGSGRWPGDGNYPVNLSVTTNPSSREVLLFPSLTLYLTSEDPGQLARLHHAFREPRYAVVLGRSQDLMAYRSVEMLELPDATSVYFDGTLLPWLYRERTVDGIGVTMPRFIDPEDRRRVVWSPFVMLPNRIRAGEGSERGTLKRGWLARGETQEHWSVDPMAPRYHGLPRGVMWHAFTADPSTERVFLSPATPSMGEGGPWHGD